MASVRMRPSRLAPGAVVLVLAAGSIAAQAPDPIAAIRRAGDAESETERLEILRGLRAAPALDPRLAADLDRMIAFIEILLGRVMPGRT
jgi:hypothetical protein